MGILNAEMDFHLQNTPSGHSAKSSWKHHGTGKVLLNRIRDIQATLLELYHVEVSHSLISKVTDAVNEEVEQWRDYSKGTPRSSSPAHDYISCTGH